ncbi:MAG: hypothetical protein WA123_11205 [Methylotenera sp.]
MSGMKGITVFNFDHSLTAQYEFLQRFHAQLNVISMLPFRRSVRLWSSERNFKKASKLMRLETDRQFSLLGSGDYHHLTMALLEQHQSPLTLVLFDNHPDWMRPPHKYHCGNWVYTAARLPQIERIVIIGLENGDLVGERFLAGDVESYLLKKIVLLPYLPIEIQPQDHQENVCLGSALKIDLQAGIQEILDTVTTDDVYVSVDKDCLRQLDAITNWEQGTLPLDTVTSCIKAIAESHNIVGADTVGDYSPPTFTSPLKWIGSMLDRPADAWRMNRQQQANVVNARANFKLAEALGFV